MSQTPRSRPAILRVSCAVVLAATLAACGDGSDDPLAAKPYDATGQIAYSTADGSRRVDPDKPLKITARGDGNKITDVTATDATGRYLRGELAADGREWHSTAPLAAGAHYTVRVSTEDEDGRPGRQTVGFDTAPADANLRVRFGPDAGVYGVGQPVTAELSRPVRDAAARAVVEGALHVTSHPAVNGAWHWVDSRTLHYRPRDFWPADARIEVTSTLQGTRVEGGLYGGPAAPLTLRTGDRVVAVTDAGAHQLTLTRNGHRVRTVPVTTGKPGFATRNGIKVVLGKEPFVRMRSSTIGIDVGSHDSYDLPVHWATRVTWSGEYVHAAPWSVGSQGSANVSHGCTGMSTDNAHWFYDQVRPGDVVEVVGSEGRGMEPFGNGFGDWNLSWSEWLRGSALAAKGRPGGHDGTARQPGDAARLAPRT
ncbi:MULTISPECIES: L,D-transpeptidase [Streptomycetaceae]|nr:MULTISPECIES: Ig-like domain-containing protein [Streptomycetaceae]MYS58351.1 L,D-transpeptidase family protein [Streptomyces sp. SID5468]